MAATKIDRRLNLVVPLDGSGFIHSTPVSLDTVAQFWDLLGRTHAQIFSNGMSVVNGPRFAWFAMKAMAEKTDADADALMNEIVRLSNVARLGADPMPLQSAITRGDITPDEWQEAQGILVFFTLVSSGNARRQVPAILAAAAELWGFQTTVLGLTEYSAWLATSKTDASSGEKAA